MISFKEFLVESRSAPLYHGTETDALQEIFKSGIAPKTYHNEKKLLKGEKDIYVYIEGISASRSKKFALQWSVGKSHSLETRPVILELNQQKLSHRFEIKPIQYWSSEGRARVNDNLRGAVRNEYEEFIITNRNLGLEYVDKIYAPEDVLKSDLVQKLKDKVPHIKWVPL